MMAGVVSPTLHADGPIALPCTASLNAGHFSDEVAGGRQIVCGCGHVMTARTNEGLRLSLVAHIRYRTEQ